MGVAARIGGVVLVTNEPRKVGEGVGAIEAGAPEWLNHALSRSFRRDWIAPRRSPGSSPASSFTNRR
jgi:hypothetical protein